MTGPHAVKTVRLYALRHADALSLAEQPMNGKPRMA